MSCRPNRLSVQLLWLVVLVAFSCLGKVGTCYGQNNPYELSFEDFEWVEPENLRPISGAKLVGEPVDYGAAIALFVSRAAESKSAAARAMNLKVQGELLLQKAKAEDDLSAYAESEAVLRRAVALDESYSPARLALAQTLMARHGFKEARKLVIALADDFTGHPATLAAVFDCEIELGNYSKAEEALNRLLKTERTAPVLARSARLAELRGERQQAIKTLVAGVADLHDMGARAEQSAWFHWRIGSIQFDRGELGAAEEQFLEALECSDEDEASLVGLARTQFAMGNQADAISNMRKAAKGAAPPVLALLGDMLADQGNESAAHELWDRTEALMQEEAKLAKAAHSREVAVFYADHDRNPDEAVALAALDIAQRDDGFAHDCQAWALLKANQIDAARVAISKAIDAVPSDNQILFHAAVIADACGDLKQAKAYARQIQNPKFSIIYTKQLQRFLQ